MYICPLCGSQYKTEAAVIRCINKCSRNKFEDGAFKKKEIPAFTSIKREGEMPDIQEFLKLKGVKP